MWSRREIRLSKLSFDTCLIMHSCGVCVDTVCLHTDVPVFALRTNTYCNWHFSSAEQHIVPRGHHSLASVDGKGQVWLANASLHISTDFPSPPPLAPVNQELMKGILWHMRHLTHKSSYFFLRPGWHSECFALWWSSLISNTASFCFQFVVSLWT